jgi:deoxyribose-phosphate aldolase
VRLPFVTHAVQSLPSDGTIKVACVIGFHEGTQSTSSKVEEARSAIEAGASELDAVLNRELLQAGKYDAVYNELKQLRELAPPEKVVMKLILETSQLSREEIIKASVLAHTAGFDFIKTSTGFCGRGASKEDVILMRACAVYLASTDGKLMKVKASGGVRGYEDARTMIELGAERIGASSGVKIVEEAVEFEKSGGTGDGKKEGGSDGY